MLNPAFLRSHIQPIYSTTKSIPSLLSSLLLPISQLSHPSFTTADLTTTLNLLPPPSNLHLLPSLSDCALALLIAAARLTILHSTDLVNFGLTYAEYVSLASKARLTSFSSGASAVGATGTRVWSKDVCRGEWERLLGIGLLVPALGTGDGVVGSAASKGMVRVDVALEEIPMAVEGLSAVMERWCKQL
jgi:origin recognition complex subunit 4